ncbi:MAG: flagellar type III secretion system pore protein FliP [Gemmatimonadota bacterium]|nr:flagellar type III secretion system pore protein FliP [Gemmatimonadota bacterium]
MTFLILTAGALALCGLALVLARVLAGARRRFGPRGYHGRVQVLERVAVGPRQGVAVVRIDTRQFAVAVGEGGVRMLTELDPEGAIPALDDEEWPDDLPPRRRGWPLRVLMLGVVIGLLLVHAPVSAQETATGGLGTLLELASSPLGAAAGDESLRLEGPVGVAVFLGLMAVLPTLVLLMTSFTRTLIVLHFLRQALGTQSAPPGQLLAALALLLTAFVMAPTFDVVNRDAVSPWMEGEIEQVEMLDRAQVPLREFMLAQTREADLGRFIDLSASDAPETPEDLSLPVLVSAFVTSELRTAFQIGFVLYLPFVVIDLVVASILMSMGMFMLPPVMVSLPIKLLLFVLVDGWGLVIEGLVRSFAA